MSIIEITTWLLLFRRLYVFDAGIEFEPRVLHMLGKYSITELYLEPLLISYAGNYRSFLLSFLPSSLPPSLPSFFSWHWSLNLGPHACYAGAC
jgi:hypothetical protein